ncbi:hypothetical protein [Streptomyces sp. NPDC126514]|uniref:hypothetical protein n=1 Tax=Streptomyces sp. NPDC126514 TaxID=3155210 RepID=UPI00331DCB90
MTTTQHTGRHTVRDEGLVWALPPMCGVLGASYTWYVRPDLRSAAAAARFVERLLGLWEVEDTSAGLAAVAAEELVSSAVKHSAPPLMLELARRPGIIALAVRSASPSAGWLGLADYVEQKGLTLADALVEELFLAQIPGQDGTAVVVHLRELPTRPATDASSAGRPDEAAVMASTAETPTAESCIGSSLEPVLPAPVEGCRV